MKRAYLIAAVVLLIGGGLGAMFQYTERMPKETVDLDRIPNNLAGYVGIGQPLDSITREVLNATAATQRRFRDQNGRTYNLFVAYFRSQKFGSGIHSPKNCLPGSGWKITSQQPLTVRMSEDQSREINYLTIGFEDRKSVMLYWFETRSGSTSSEFGLKWNLFTAALLLRPDDAAFIRVTVPVMNDDFDQALREGIEFVRSIHPTIAVSLPFE